MPAIGDYSTSEQDTGFTWIDGKHIYKKTFFISSLPNTGFGLYSHNISNIDIVVKIEGFYSNSNGTFFPANTSRPNETIGIGTFIDPLDKIKIDVGTSNRTNYHGYVTLYYTKTS